MPLIDILEKINKESAEHISKLEKEFGEKKLKLEEKNKEKQKDLDKEIHAKVEEKSGKIMEKAENLAEREEKNQILKAKRQMIDEILDESIDQLSKSDEYEKIITDMLKKADIEDENTVVVPAKGKEEVTKSAIKNAGKPFFLSDKSADIKGGFILKTNKVEIDNAFETIIKSQLRDDLEIKMNKLLFQ